MLAENVGKVTEQTPDVTNVGDNGINAQAVWDWNAPHDLWERMTNDDIKTLLGIEDVKTIAEVLKALGAQRIEHPFKHNGKSVRGWLMPPLAKSSSMFINPDAQALTAEHAQDATDTETAQDTAPPEPIAETVVEVEAVELEAAAVAAYWDGFVPLWKNETLMAELKANPQRWYLNERLEKDWQEREALEGVRVAAQTLAKQGLRVFPCVPDEKRPAIAEWQQKATSDPEEVHRLFTNPKFNVGIACGATGGDFDLVVVDVDVKGTTAGFAGLRAAEAEWGKLPDTLTAQTPSGGEHYYFRVPKGSNIASTKLVTPSGEQYGDFQSHGKLVITPPSVFKDKDGVHKHYRWTKDFPIAELPAAWVAYYKGKRTAKSASNYFPSTHEGPKPIDDEIRHILDQTRNDIERVEWLKVLSVCSGYDGGEELARDWSSDGEYATRFDAGAFETAWNEVESRVNGGEPMHIGTLVNISNAYNRNKGGYEPYRKPTIGSEHLASGGDALNATLEAAHAETLGELPSVETLLERIQKNAGSDSGAWLAHAVLSAEESRIAEYQHQHPTTSKGEARKLLGGDGAVDWAVATYTAAMHVGGEVLIAQSNRRISAVKELTKEDAGKVTTLVYEVFKCCAIAQTWVGLQTTKSANMHNVVVSAVQKAHIQRKQGSLSNSSIVVNPDGQAGKLLGFGSLGDSSAKGTTVEGVAAPTPPAAGKLLGFGSLGDSIAKGTAVAVASPITLGSVGSLPPKRERAGKMPPLELMKDAMLAEKKGKWFACKETREIYTLTEGGWYEHVPADDAETEVAEVKEREGIKIGSMNAVKDAVRLLQKILPKVEFCTVPHLIPMRNGVLDSETRQLHPYKEMLPFNWHIPHDYTDSESCDVWKGFISKQFGGDEGRAKTLQAFLRCMVGGAYQAQKYLEVVGTGGSGKSQLMNVCIALMGEANTVTSSLSALDGKDGTSRFETSNLYGKKLVVMPDQEKFFGTSSNFQCVTGNDPIRNERKNVQAGSQFTYQGFVIVTANQFMNPKNNGGAILRRRVPVKMDVVATDAEKARYPDGIGQYIIDHELTGVLNWVLAMPLSEAREQLRNPDAYTKQLNNEVEDGNNPVRAWLRDDVVSCGRGEETLIGNDIRDPLAKSSPEWGLYASYCDYCRGAGNTPTNRKGFVDTVLNEARGKGVEYIKETKRNHNKDKWILSFLRLRTLNDE